MVHPNTKNKKQKTKNNLFQTMQKNLFMSNVLVYVYTMFLFLWCVYENLGYFDITGMLLNTGLFMNNCYLGNHAVFVRY